MMTSVSGTTLTIGQPEPAISAGSATQVLSLDSSWEISGFDPHGTRRISGLAAEVPGHVHPALQRAGLIPDPFWRDQADQCQWVEHWEWRYRRSFVVPEEFPQQWVVLQFDGLDTFATILLNGKEVGVTENMFIQHEFDITGCLRPGKNTIEVRFAPAVASVEQKPHRNYEAIFNPKGERTYIRRMQCTFGWDWVPRLVSAGIWQPCRIVSYPNVRIEDLFVWTSHLNRDFAELKLELTTAIRLSTAYRAHLTITDPEGHPVWEKTLPLSSEVIKIDARVGKPQLWWPNGAGEQPLYHVTAELLDSNDAVLSRREQETGMRTVTVEQVPDADGSGSCFTLVVNGQRIFAKGGNWVPADPFPSRITSDHYARLLGQARDAGMNMLRSWGGGIYEPEAFWRACDEMGIMVSQDFLLACATYPEDDLSFTNPLKREIACGIRMLRNHPSLVFWCGDNELGLNFKANELWSFKKFHEDVTASMMGEMDPSRVFRLTSPFGGHLNNSPLAGDCHLSAQYTDAMTVGNMRDYREQIELNVGRFMSEHAAGGSPPKRTLLRFMTEDDLAGTEMWECHTRDNPYVGTKGGLTLHHVFQRQAKLLYGDAQSGSTRCISQMEYLQYELVRLGLETSRRRKFWCSGIQFWMFNDCWPASSYSMVDYWGGRKASWYAMAAGCRPVIAASEATGKCIRWWVCNDLLEAVTVEVEIRVQPWQGAARWSKNLNVTVPSNSSIPVIELSRAEVTDQLGTDAALVCNLSHPGGYDRSWWFPGLPKEMSLPAAKLHVMECRNESEGSVTIRSENWARVVSLDADLDFSDNYFDMLPGETRTIGWKALQRPFTGEIRVSCWNP
jgi:beta-mannosidase